MIELQARVERRADGVQLRPLLLIVFTVLFWSLGFAVSWTVHTIWLVVRWSWAAAAEGWQDGKTRAAGARSA